MPRVLTLALPLRSCAIFAFSSHEQRGGGGDKSNIPCKYGEGCNRTDCPYQHAAAAEVAE